MTKGIISHHEQTPTILFSQLAMPRAKKTHLVLCFRIQIKQTILLIELSSTDNLIV